MIIVANMVESLCPNQIADNAVARRTAEGFATVKQDGKGWTWEPHAIGLGPLLPVPQCHTFHSARPMTGYSAP